MSACFATSGQPLSRLYMRSIIITVKGFGPSEFDGLETYPAALEAFVRKEDVAASGLIVVRQALNGDGQLADRVPEHPTSGQSPPLPIRELLPPDYDPTDLDQKIESVEELAGFSDLIEAGPWSSRKLHPLRAIIRVPRTTVPNIEAVFSLDGIQEVGICSRVDASETLKTKKPLAFEIESIEFKRKIDQATAIDSTRFRNFFPILVELEPGDVALIRRGSDPVHYAVRNLRKEPPLGNKHWELGTIGLFGRKPK
jgi:hypothetical protein